MGSTIYPLYGLEQDVSSFKSLSSFTNDDDLDSMHTTDLWLDLKNIIHVKCLT